MENKRILTICKKRIDSYGSAIGLVTSARFISNYLNDRGLDSKLVEVIDANSIDKEVTEFNPDVVIIEALWVTPDKFRELLKIGRHRWRKWIVRIHSKLPFLANEGIAIDWIREYFKVQEESNLINFIICPNNQELTEQLNGSFNPQNPCITLPNIYYPKSKVKDVQEKECYYYHIASMGAVRPLKNQLLQAMAAIEFGNIIGQNVAFHINGTRVEQQGNNIYKNIVNLFKDTNHKLVEHGWVSHSEFLNLIKDFDLGLQCSFSESFNVVTADFAFVETPILASDDINWMPYFSKVSPTDYKGIVNKMLNIYNYPWFHKKINKLALECYNKKAFKKWNKFLEI